jgi:hydrogenase maturation protease
MATPARRAVVIGIGNPYRRDDGVGPAVIEELRRRHLAEVDLAESEGEPTHLLELWSHAALAVVVDALRLADPRPGRIHRRSVHHPALRGSGPASSHGVELGDAVALAEALDRMPHVLAVYAVEVADTGYGVGLTPAVATAAATVTAEIVAQLRARAGARP